MVFKLESILNAVPLLLAATVFEPNVLDDWVFVDIVCFTPAEYVLPLWVAALANIGDETMFTLLCFISES